MVVEGSLAKDMANKKVEVGPPLCRLLGVENYGKLPIQTFTVFPFQE